MATACVADRVAVTTDAATRDAGPAAGTREPADAAAATDAPAGTAADADRRPVLADAVDTRDAALRDVRVRAGQGAGQRGGSSCPSPAAAARSAAADERESAVAAEQVAPDPCADLRHEDESLAERRGQWTAAPRDGPELRARAAPAQ